MEQNCFLEYSFSGQGHEAFTTSCIGYKYFRDCNFVIGKGHKTVRFEIFTAEGSADG